MEPQGICAATTAPSSSRQQSNSVAAAWHPGARYRSWEPWQNGKEERFNGTVRDECLNMRAVKTVAEAWLRLSAFRQEYNTLRPHSSLGELAPHMLTTAWLAAKAKSEESHILP
jgi:transposase InsO family protein